MALIGSFSQPETLTGSLSSPSGLSGNVSKNQNLSGKLSDTENTLNGSLSNHDSLIGLLSSPKALSGVVENVVKMKGVLSNATLRGYSAYEIAVLSGYQGTDEEWLESLRGERMEMRNNAGVLEYRYLSDNSWSILVDLNTLVGDYEMLVNRPKIDGTTLSGDRDLSEDYVKNDWAMSNLEIEELLTF